MECISYAWVVARALGIAKDTRLSPQFARAAERTGHLAVACQRLTEAFPRSPTAGSQPRKRRVDTAKVKGYHMGMQVTAEQVVVDALGLSPPLQAFVAERLLESLDIPDATPLSARWRREIRRRCADLDRGAVELRDADQVFAKVYAV